MLENRDDREALYAYVDRLHQEGNWIEMHPVDSVDDLEQYPEFTARFCKDSQSRNKA